MRTNQRSDHGAPCLAYGIHQPTSYKIRKLGCIPGNRPPITTKASAMIDGVVGGEQHVVGQSEDMLRHCRGCGDDGKASRGKAT